MPILSILKSYQDGNVLFAQDLDNIVNSIETFLNVTKLDADNIQNGAIGTQQLAVGAITTDKIAPGAVVTAAIADGAVTTAKISDGAITTAKISDGAVTRAKLTPVGEQISASSGEFNTSSTSFVDITNLSVTLTTTGRPVWVGFRPVPGVVDSSRVRLTAGAEATIQATRGGTPIAEARVGNSGPTFIILPIPGFLCLDTPAAGTYEYKIRAKTQLASHTFSMWDLQLVVFEL